MRHVSQEEDQVRWQDARLHPLPQLQDRVHLHTGREETPTSQRVRSPPALPWSGCIANLRRAKYIEGLENRLARMESLMRLSGVLPDDDDGSTDLATIERRLADRASRNGTPAAAHTPSERRQSSVPPAERSDGTPTQQGLPSPTSGTTSPEPARETHGPPTKEEDALAEMMCSLVTNNCGETRYIGG